MLTRVKGVAKRQMHGHGCDTPRGVPLLIDVSFISREMSHKVLTEAGWKSDIEKHIFLSGAKRPEGVSICEELGKRVVWPIVAEYLDARRLERVFGWKHQNSMVLPSFER